MLVQQALIPPESDVLFVVVTSTLNKLNESLYVFLSVTRLNAR